MNQSFSMGADLALDTPLVSPRRKGISLTALIDVVFILLVFFMLTSSFSKWTAVDLDLPISAQQASGKANMLMLKEDGSLSFLTSVAPTNHGLVFQNLDDFIAKAALNNEATLVLVTEANVSVQEIVSALEQLKASGLSKVTLGGSQQPKAEG